MELTLGQALQKGIEAHKAGQIQDAERLYTAILKTQPKHPDANHNMGLLAVGVGKLQEALPFFKTALEAKPSTGQFWLSYIDALMKLGRSVDAQSVFDQAKDKGASGEAFDQLEKQLLEQGLQVNEPYTMEVEGSNSPKPNILDTTKLDKALRLAKRKSREGQPEEATNIYEDIIQKFPKNKQALIALQLLSGGARVTSQDPPSNKLQSVINLYTQGQLEEALSKTTQMLERFPNSVALYNIAGASYAGLMQFDAAMVSYKQALRIKPDYADAYNNMGVALTHKGDLEAAIDSCKQALKIKPDYAEAYNNIGNALTDKGDLDAAVDSYKQALKIKPDFAEAYINMGNTLQDKGDLEAAIDSYKRALSMDPNNTRVQYSLDALSGVQTNTVPREYVEHLFDNYAGKFDHSLVNDLAYEIPEILSKIMVSSWPDRSLGSILDLGCGTGLAGVALKPFCSNLEGIDLSRSMLEKAEQKNIYDKLTYIDIIEYLSEAELDFDYFICTDVFVYVGDLSKVFNLIKSRNKRKAKLAFSTEHTDRAQFFLETSGRYSHSKSYIEDLCAEFGYRITHFSTSNLRKEREGFIAGGIYLLDF